MESTTDSLGFSLSKGTVYEEILPFGGDSIIEIETISNEQIMRGDEIAGIYEVVSDPIHGGMGSVWKVHHNRWNTDLAMKRPQPRFFAEGSEKRKERFVQECEAWINLELHPNIVSCYYVREIGGVPTIFSEWMENGSLKNRIDDGSLYEIPDGQDVEEESAQLAIQARLLDIAIQFARGLHYAHESEGHLVHQDVKPDNLLLTKGWEAKVADFGLARARTQLAAVSSSQTGTEDLPAGVEGAVEDRLLSGVTHIAPAGGYTPAYCSSEQALGSALTRRTDIFSWAVSVMEMYYGARPWSSGTEAAQNCREYFPRSRVNMPEALADLLERCMSFEPADRPETFEAVEHELHEIYREAIGETYPRPEPEAAANTADSLNNRALSFLDLDKKENAEACFAEALAKTPDHAESLYNQSLYLWREGRMSYEEMLRHCSEAGQLGDEGEGSREQDRLRQVNDEKSDTDPRTFKVTEKSFSYYAQVDHHTQVRISQDGERIYTALDTVTCRRAESLETEYCNADIAGRALIDKLLLTSNERYLLVHKMPPRKSSVREEDGPRDIGDAEKLFVLDVASGRTVRILLGHASPITAICSHPESVYCYTADELGSVRKWNLVTGWSSRIVDGLPDFGGDGEDAAEDKTVKSLNVSPDGRLLCGVFGNAIFLWDESTRELFGMQVEDPHLASACFSGDGGTVYACGEYGFYLLDLNTLSLSQVSTDTPLRHLQSAMNGNVLLTYDAQCNIKVWDPNGFKRLRILHGLDRRFESIDAEAGLAQIVAGDNYDNVMIWDLRCEVRYAPWELSRIKEYHAVIARERETDQLMAEIRKAIDDERIDSALELLRKAESEYDSYDFFPLRRELMACCRRGACERVYELVAYKLKDRYFDLEDDVTFGAFIVDQQSGDTAIRYSFEPIMLICDEKGGRLAKFTMPESFTWDYLSESVRYSRSGKYLAVGGKDCVLIYDPKDGAVLKELKGRQFFAFLALSPDDKRAAAIGEGLGGNYWMGVWNVQTGELLQAVPPHTMNQYFKGFEGALGLDFTPDGKQLVVVSGYGLKVYDLASSKFVKTLSFESSCNGFHLCADTGVVYVYTTKGILPIDIESWQEPELHELRLNGEVISDYGLYKVSPDETMIAGAVKGAVGLWTLPDFTPIGDFSGFESIWELSFSNDSSLLFAIGANTVHSIAIQKRLEFPGFVDWDETADAHISNFLMAYPHPDEKQVQMLLTELRNRGMGFIRQDGVRAKVFGEDNFASSLFPEIGGLVGMYGS